MRDLLDILFVVPREVPGLLGPLKLQMILADYRFLDLISASLIDRMRDVGVKLVRRTFDLTQILSSQPRSTLVAIIASHVVLATAPTTPRSHLATRHRDERTVRPFDDLQISNNKRLVKCNRAESPQAVF
jgi:hypothetical protein